MKMFEKIKEQINKNKKLTVKILLAVILIGGFLRVCQYHDWLFFKWDQARDATLVSEAVEKGPGYLPLLGPRATKVGEDYLRLGPAFYYAQYLSGVIFQSTKPEVFAYPDTFFAILTIPLLFLFLRLYFSRFNSLFGTTLYTFSFLVIQYSRFAWNPNAVPFWMLLAFYALLRMLKEKKYKSRIIYLAVFSFALLIATQYHFFAMFGLMAIISVFFFFYLKVWKIKKFLEKIKAIFSRKTAGYILIFLTMFGIVYLPVIVSDIKTDWSNSKNFIGAFSEKPRDDKTFGEKLLRNFREQAKNYTLITTSFWSREGKKADPYPVVFGLFLMVSGIILPLWQRRKIDDLEKRNFLLLIPIWIIMFFLITISVSYQLRPRYFTPVFPVPFIVIIFWLSFLQKIKFKKSLFFVLIIFSAFLLMNIYGTVAWFKDNIIAQKREFPTDRNFILKKDDGVTLGQLEKVADYLFKNRQANKIVFYSKAEYSLPIEYLLLEKSDNLEIYFIAESTDLIGHSQFFAMNTIKGGFDSIPKKVKDYAGQPESSKQFGELAVFNMKTEPLKLDKLKNLIIQEGAEKENNEENAIEGENEDESKTERLFWKDML